MAATADPRAKPPAAPPHHLQSWGPAHQPPAPAHRFPVVAPPAGASCAPRDRRRPSAPAHRRVGGAAGQDVTGDDGGIEELRAKLMGHLRDAADRLRVPQPSPALPPLPPPPPPPPESDSEPEPELRAPPPPPLLPPPPPTQEHQPPQADVADTARPWNLRERSRRRPAAKSWAASPPASRRRRKRAPFSVSLTAEEIEEDIYALTGARPRRRPRKRPRVVQRQLDTLFPGLWLTDITADAYRVPDE
ncbi:hypothetical protein PR202_gb02031 [Eleusine coracana subsp. coracana]|uniref:Uncharacterized protein n=1 Tax=Eleusine coracana subsp. coracana TaxID=191504 RepID=A0AAV5DX64_ELECO|nr:hypothetical protein QOZ80_5BG0412250 [Eleusine coracana subsp. coracana]GJN15138.1 hypothetical protein PR202_gb02031 [Eleusine coracana subsp. coracana]